MHMCVCVHAVKGGFIFSAGQQNQTDILTLLTEFKKCKIIGGAGEMFQQLRTLAALSEDPGLVPDTNMEPYNSL